MLSALFNRREKIVKNPDFIEILTAFIGGSLSIVILLILSQWSGHLWIMAPFGATCVLLYAAAQSPLAQPKNVILGHVISAFIGLVFLKIFGIHYWSMGLAVGCAIASMQYFGCVHPPAGANPLVILLTASSTDYSWSFLIFPVLTGAVTLVIFARCVHYIVSKNPD